MAFQSVIYPAQGFGVPGDLYNNGPKRARSYILNSASAAYNIIGVTCFTMDVSVSLDDQHAVAGNPPSGPAGQYVGLLVNSKVYASFGTSAGGPLAPTMTLANNVQAEFATEGSFYTVFPANCKAGDLVVYDTTTGAISTILPTDELPSGKTFAQAMVDFYDVTTGVGIITLTPTLVTPQPAPLLKADVANEANAKKSKGAN